ncbi:MAG: fumarylacetoacetate hydrolase family protein [Candidatus Hinthialibacter antarcticus]|nr:fumarylacetoacetate hydrolase family protein [Candidatus Hinthialibacter antarcticus]
MKLVRFGELGKEKPGVLSAQGEVLDVSPWFSDFDEAFFASGGVNQLASNIADAPKAPSGVRLGAPVARPSKIIAIGLNYSDHAKESGMEPPPEPVLFFKAATALSGPFDNVEVPRGALKTDWEVELAFVIGKRAKYVSEAEADQYIAGYSVLNDVSERAFQLEHSGQWVKGKSHDTFAPMGPWLVTPDEAGDVESLDMTLDVNGERRQTGNTSTMIFKPRFLVHYLSQFMTLAPGDIVTTGTPPGVGMGMKPQQFLKPGDVMELSIQNLGSQKQTCVPA